jgi:hypothetical protein
MDRPAHLAARYKTKYNYAFYGKQGPISWTIPLLLGPPPKDKSNFCGVKGFSPDVLHPAILILTH